MPNVLTHKYLKSNSVQDNGIIQGKDSPVVDIYWDCFPDLSDTFTMIFTTGGPEVFVGDTITFSGGAVGKVEALTHASGTWAGGDEQGTITVSQLTKHVAAEESATTDSGGVIGLIATFAIDSFRDTSETDCSEASLVVTEYAEGDYLQPSTAAFSPANANPWNEISGVTQTDHFDTILLMVAKNTATTWNISFGNVASVTGFIKLNAVTDELFFMDTSGAAVTVSLTSPLPHDGESHSYAIILRRGSTNTITLEVDGVITGIGTLDPAEDFQFTAENDFTFASCKLQGFLSARFRDGLPSDYQEAVADALTRWSAGNKGIPPRFVGIR